MSNAYQTTIHIHPAAVKWLDAHFVKVDDAYDVRTHPIYVLIQSGLARKNIKMPQKKSVKLKKNIPVKFLVNEWDFYHFGWTIPNATQEKISKYLYKTMLMQFCRDIASAYVYGSFPIDVVVRRILIEYLFDDNELSYYNLRKFYSRNYTEKEKELFEFKRIMQYTMTQ